jgi:hypothetical protein
MRRILLLGIVVIAFQVATFSCGGSTATFPDSGSPPDDASTAGEDGTVEMMDASTDPDTGTCRGCSGDLHNVVDCMGNVIMTCTPDQACAPGGICQPACDAARAQKSSIGCDYYAVNPGSFPQLKGDCFAAYIANTWNADLSITVTYDGQMLNIANLARIPTGSGNITYTPLPNGKLPPGQVAILFLADASGQLKCPQGITPGVQTETSSAITEYIKPFKISTSVPAAAFDIYPYGGQAAFGTTSTLLIPVSAWGTNHVAVHGYARSQAHNGDHLFLQLVSDEDNNQVTITPTSAIVAGNNVAATAQNMMGVYTINKGQVLQIQQDGDLAGSPITSTKPLGLWGGNACFNIEVTDTYCDISHQQLPPVSAMASEYVAVKHKDRGNAAESPPWRVVGTVDGTQLTYLPSTPNGAPTSINAKQLVKFTAAGPFVVKSQDSMHPFYFSAHMTSGSNATGIGDPEHVNVIPPAQWLQDYDFMTDPTMGNTNLVLVRGKAADNTYKDVSLDCLSGPVTGWTAISGTDYQTTNVDLAKGGQGQNGCNNGAHNAKSTWPFALTVWGWDPSVSYAYPGGASFRPINGVILPQGDM